MGGHGALVIGLRNAAMFRSISAFAPIVNPCECPWGVKAFSGYLGEDRAAWAEWDACALLKAAERDMGSAVLFLATFSYFTMFQIRCSTAVLRWYSCIGCARGHYM